MPPSFLALPMELQYMVTNLLSAEALHLLTQTCQALYALHRLEAVLRMLNDSDEDGLVFRRLFLDLEAEVEDDSVFSAPFVILRGEGIRNEDGVLTGVTVFIWGPALGDEDDWEGDSSVVDLNTPQPRMCSDTWRLRYRQSIARTTPGKENYGDFSMRVDWDQHLRGSVVRATREEIRSRVEYTTCHGSRTLSTGDEEIGTFDPFDITTGSVYIFDIPCLRCTISVEDAEGIIKLTEAALRRAEGLLP